jgi:signal transduction histidine kinase
MMKSGRAGRTVVKMTVAPAQATVNARPGHRGPWAADTVVALAVCAAQVGGTYGLAAHRSLSISPSGVALLTVGSAVLVARRRFPVAVLATTFVTTLWYVSTPNPSGAIWVALIVAFSTAIYLRRRLAAISFLVAAYVGFLWGPVILDGHRAPAAVFALALATGLLVLVGASEGIRMSRQRSAALTRSREEEALRRASEERLRMARDLHDFVAHNISVINVQANTALHLMDRQPERARTALSTINEVSKQALVELRSVLGVLRGVDEEVPRAPSPTLRHLDELVATAEAAGLGVQLEFQGEAVPLSANLDLAGYRIVQESLTNAVRHSGGSAAVVRIFYGHRDIVLQVDDDGAGCGSPRRSESGSGIVGMTERAHALGGELQAGPRSDGGFRVHARLPLEGTTA